MFCGPKAMGPTQGRSGTSAARARTVLARRVAMEWLALRGPDGDFVCIERSVAAPCICWARCLPPLEDLLERRGDERVEAHRGVLVKGGGEEVRDALGVVLHVEGGVRSAPQHQKCGRKLTEQGLTKEGKICGGAAWRAAALVREGGTDGSGRCTSPRPPSQTYSRGKGVTAAAAHRQCSRPCWW
jgi:hypothetical protein